MQQYTTNKYKTDLLEALNRIDNLACYAVEEGNEEEANQLRDDYNLLFNFINEKL